MPGFYNPPWTIIPLIPFAILPERFGSALMIMAAIASLAYVSHRMGAKPIAVILLVLSPPALHGYLSGNIDWLPVIGYLMPPQIGLFFISIKPQLGLGVGVYWLAESWREGGWRKTLQVFAPVAIGLLLSFALFGLWPLKYNFNAEDWWWNASLWPTSLPVGLGLMVAALRTRRIEYAIAASPCFSPYVLFHSWVVVLIAIVAATPEFIATLTGLWGLIAIRATTGGK
ncbi:MAG: hypothetical protein HND51_17465 [Chloroflexi bacterium]|nr:hypothetical protein [Chloroflexota bacterium]